MKRTLFIIVFTAMCFNAGAQSKDEKLDSLYYSLPEAMVTGEKPIVRLTRESSSMICHISSRIFLSTMYLMLSRNCRE